MNPELTGFALGLLVGATKVLAIGAVGFGIAWWRARRRLRELEIELERLEQPVANDALRSLEQGFADIDAKLDQLLLSQRELRERLAGPAEPTHRLPESSGRAPRN